MPVVAINWLVSIASALVPILLNFLNKHSDEFPYDADEYYGDDE